MSKNKKGWLAIIVAYRKEEKDLQATLDSAADSAGAGAVIIAVEDKDRSGPGRNRHRGIEAAKDAEAIILIDAHMRFKGDVLRRMGRQVKSDGGLLVPFCHNNETCSLNTPHYYAGARMVWAAQDDDIKQRCALVAKWAKSDEPGPRPAVMGACYAFRRDWYYKVGQPLSMLVGWGCDEELLSIAMWMSGKMPEVIDGHVAHLYRARSPWEIATIDHQRVTENRRRMIGAVVDDEQDRRELFSWQGNQDTPPTDESRRFSAALRKMKRTWGQWKKEVCEPPEINGISKDVLNRAIGQHIENVTKRQPTITTPLGKTKCPHCGEFHDPYKLRVLNSYPNGKRRHECPTCSKPFISMFSATI